MLKAQEWGQRACILPVPAICLPQGPSSLVPILPYSPLQGLNSP